MLLLNWSLYKFFYAHSMEKAGKDLQAMVDQNKVDPAQLVTLKVPINNSYISIGGNETFERMEGSLEEDGTIYQFIKKRVYRDTLEVVCIPNNQQKALKKNNEALQKQLLQLALGGGKTKKGATEKNDTQDWFTQNLQHSWAAILLQDSFQSRNNNSHLLKGHLTKLYKPPIG